MKWRKKFSSFSFTRNEREGLISLLILIVLFIGGQRYVSSLGEPQWKPTEKDILAYIQSEDPRKESKTSFAKNDPVDAPEKEEAHFSFDPNTISDEEWEELGLSAKQVASLRKYMSFGYPFRAKEDLRKVYVLDSLWLDRHWDEITIQPIAQENPAEPVQKSSEYVKSKTEEDEEIRVFLNSADTIELASVRGIGSYSARRVWAFREALGGFISLEQLGEVYGIREEAALALAEASVLDSSAVRKLNVNSAEKEAFGQHPYCPWKVASAIVKYRAQHGPFTEIDELKHIYLMTDSIFVKLKPYLSIAHED